MNLLPAVKFGAGIVTTYFVDDFTKKGLIELAKHAPEIGEVTKNIAIPLISFGVCTGVATVVDDAIDEVDELGKEIKKEINKATKKKRKS